MTREQALETKENKTVEGKTALQVFADFLALSAGRDERYQITCSETAFVISRNTTMTTPESKEKCCDAPKADWHRDCNCHCHQRPESDWREEYRARFGNLTLGILSGDKGSPVFVNNDLEVSRLLSFIACHLQTEYERGFSDGGSQSERLLENNRDLQAKLREGNRAILKEILAHFEEQKCQTHKENAYDCLYCGYGRAMRDVRNYLNFLLSFQQEPQDKNETV